MDQVIADATAVVLAGGRSTRFGADKALADWRGVPLAAAVAASLRGAFPRVLVVAKEGQERSAPGAEVVRDARALAHPLSGLEAGLRACATPWAFVVACDMPFAGPGLAARLAPLRTGARAAAARWRGRLQPFGAFYARAALPELGAALDRGASATAFLEALEPRVLDLDDAETDLHDLDDRAAYDGARALAARR